MKFGEYLKAQRENAGWTQPEAASRIAIEQSYLSKLENDKAVPSAEIFDRLMQAYQFTVKQISEQVTSTELEKLKDIVLVREFIVSSKKADNANRRKWLLAGLVMVMLGSLIFSAGIAVKEYYNETYIYESKGVVKDDEVITLFTEMPHYERFKIRMNNEPDRDSLADHPLFSRLDYQQVSWDHDRGSFYDINVVGGKRRFNFVGQKITPNRTFHYAFVALGAMLIMGGLACFYISRRW
ncbi:helix-turn-helix domain-containing protein [Arsukibacterium indicum]|uniref:Helix-turn-helix domain-containing protein n=1 Tax=Arsukibacterium indicum TaxID=2848612 RepID=A0ABS6MP89_9GAMM|nr:helix-turn-helix transcriptional regulator [Arsukibacterium indicum]MBV2130638.1 helix-turn-helix domain-containing protein [Arsukibacterium indicum]